MLRNFQEGLGNFQEGLRNVFELVEILSGGLRIIVRKVVSVMFTIFSGSAIWEARGLRIYQGD